MPLYRSAKSRYWWVRFSVGGVKTRCSARTADKALAEEFEAKLKSDRWRQYRLGERPAYTWAQAVARWYETAQGRDREQDHARLKWFSEYLADTPLRDITPEIIEKLKRVRAAEAAAKRGGNGRNTANRHLSVLRMLLRAAHRQWNWIDPPPAVPMYRIEKREPRYITRAQFRTLKDELPEHLAELAEFSVETGLRMRNATGLTWDQVDLRRSMLTVPASRAKGGETIAIPLSSAALRVVKAQRGRHATHVFTYQKGPKSERVPIDDANGTAWKKATARAGVPWLRWHDLRHTWASWGIQAGVPPHALQELGGWKSAEMVKRYGHLSVEHLRAYVKRRRG